MNAQDLFLALGEIDEAHLAGIDTVKKSVKAPVWQRVGAVAACVAVAALMVAGLYVGVLSSQNTPPTTDEPSASFEDQSVLSGLVSITEESDVDTVVYPTSNELYDDVELREEETSTLYTYETLCAQSSVILQAQVLGQYYDPYDTLTLSDTAQAGHRLYAKVRVEYVYKFSREIVGDDILYIKDNGYGSIGEDGSLQAAETIGGGPLMETGNRVLLFLNLSESNDTGDVYDLSVPAVSKFYYDADELYHSSALYQPQDTDDHTVCRLSNDRPRSLTDILIACGLREKQTISLIPFGEDEGFVDAVVYPTSNPCYHNSASLMDWSHTTFYTYKELMHGADEVLVVNVLGQYRKKDSWDLYAKVQVEISGLKPSVAINDGDILYIKDNGWGMFDGDGELVEAQTEGGGPLMEKGNRLLVFLKESEECADLPVYELVVGAVSKFYYDEDGCYHASGLYQSEGSGNAHPAMLADYTPKTLMELQAELGKDDDFGLGITFAPTKNQPHTIYNDKVIVYPDHGPF